MKRVRAYTKNPAIDPEEAARLVRQEQVFKTRALAAIEDNAGLKQAAAELARDNLTLKVQVYRLTEKVLLLEADTKY